MLLCKSDVNEVGRHFPTVDFVFAENKKVSLAPDNYLFKVGHSTTLNRGIKGTEKLKGPFKQNCTYLDHDVQPPHTSITIDVHHRKIFI